MIELTREVRFSLLDESASSLPVTNSWGGWPTASRLAPWLTLACTVRGNLDPASGYLCDIKTIDDAVRQHVIKPACKQASTMSGEPLLRFAWQQLHSCFPDSLQLTQMRLGVTPHLDYRLNTDNLAMIELTQEFEFSASHRLHNPQWSDAENRKRFGKCNNPHGHGHNYVVAVTIGNAGDGGQLPPLPEFEAHVRQQVIDRLDHKYLNLEVDEFRELNPSVENIAIVIWNMLDNSIGQASLRRVRVYETPKTWADYCGS